MNIIKNKLLIIAPSWIGDMVMAQSLFKHLKMIDQDLEIHVIAPEWTYPLLERMPEVTSAMQITFKHGELSLLERYKIAKSLVNIGYSKAIILPNSWKSALIPWIAKIPKRTGWLGEQRFLLLNDFRFLNKTRYTTMVERYIALAYPKDYILPSKFLYPKLLINSKNLELIKLKFSLNKDNYKAPILALCIGAAFGDAKCWPIESFIALAYMAAKHNNFNVWIFGSINNLQINNNNHLDNIINFSGKTSLLEAIDLLSLTDIVVCNDSGLMHIAASLNKKIIAIYGATSEKFTPPLTTNYTIINKKLACSPCFARTCPLQHHNCMQQITVEEVFNQVQLIYQN